jgi:phosphoribosylcarboxyaminoimidazole (NCAIR) mutase
VPVATVAIGQSGAENAAILAAQILALQDKRLAVRLQRFKDDMGTKVEEKNQRLQEKVASQK